MALSSTIFPLLITRVQETFHATAVDIGRASTALFLGAIAVYILGTYAADYVTVKTLCCVGFAVFAGGFVLQVFAPTVWFLTMATCVQGIGAGLIDLFVQTIVSATFPEKRTAALAFTHAFFCVGGVVNSFVVTWALSFGVTWRTISLVSCLPPVALAVAFATQPLPKSLAEADVSVTKGSPVTPSPLVELLREPDFLICLLLMWLAGAAQLGPVTWIPAFAEQTLGMSYAGIVLFGFTITMGTARYVGSKLAVHVSGYTLLQCAGVLQFALTFTAAVTSGMLSAGLLSGIGFGVSVLWPTTLAVSADRHPRGKASMFACLAIAGSAGGAVMPYVCAYVMDTTHSQRAGMAVAATPGLGAFIAASVLRCMSPPEPHKQQQCADPPVPWDESGAVLRTQSPRKSAEVAEELTTLDTISTLM